MRYVALLRGINVGGNARVEMPRLKRVFESAGCQDVATYINSGNVIFSDGREPAELVKLLEAAIKDEFSLAVPVIIRDQDNITMLAAKIPSRWANDKIQKTDVLFLWDNVDDKGVLDKVKVDPAIENVLYLPGALVWNIGREDVARGGGIKLIKTDLYKYVTVRNINTVRRLSQLMKHN